MMIEVHITDWRIRWILHFESFAFPIGFGLLAGSLVGFVFHPGQAIFATMIVGVLYLGDGLWSPMHRQLGLTKAVYVGRGRWWIRE